MPDQSKNIGNLLGPQPAVSGPTPLPTLFPPVPAPAQRQVVPVGIQMPQPPDKTGMAIEFGGVPGNQTPVTGIYEWLQQQQALAAQRAALQALLSGAQK